MCICGFLPRAQNGFHLGQFAFISDKRLPYENDIRVPLIICGPPTSADGLRIGARGSVSNAAVLNIDIAPTILGLAGLPTPAFMDGVSIFPLQTTVGRVYPSNAGDERQHAAEERAAAEGATLRTLNRSSTRTFLTEYWGSGSTRAHACDPPGSCCATAANCTTWPSLPAPGAKASHPSFRTPPIFNESVGTCQHTNCSFASAPGDAANNTWAW